MAAPPRRRLGPLGPAVVILLPDLLARFDPRDNVPAKLRIENEPLVALRLERGVHGARALGEHAVRLEEGAVLRVKREEQQRILLRGPLRWKVKRSTRSAVTPWMNALTIV